METKYFKGMIMLFGLFRIRGDFAFWQEFRGKDVQIGAAYVDNVKYIKRLAEQSRSKYLQRIEPFLRNICTIKWIETTPENEPIPCYF